MLRSRACVIGLVLSILLAAIAVLSVDVLADPATTAMSNLAQHGIYLPLVRRDRPIPTPTPTATTGPTPTPTQTRQPGAQLKLYLKSEGRDRILSLVPVPVGTTIQYYLYRNSPVDWSITLSGDLVGNRYAFSLVLASFGSSTVDASIILKQGATEIALASTTFSMTSTYYARFQQDLDGPDPAASAGDILLLRMNLRAGSRMAVQAAAPPVYDSYILVPGY